MAGIQPRLTSAYYGDNIGRRPGMRARDRRLALLRFAAGGRRSSGGWVYPDWCRERGIGIHCEGGIALKDPDLQHLIRRGFLRVVRVKGPRSSHGGSNTVNRTRAQITEQGWDALWNEKE